MEMLKTKKTKAPRNRTLDLSRAEIEKYRQGLKYLDRPALLKEIKNRIIKQDCLEALPFLPEKSIDLVFADPPYNLAKKFRDFKFKEQTDEDYGAWLDSWIKEIVPKLKPGASIYICGDWKSSSAIFRIASRYFQIRNRITFERDKGRGAKKNWKNCSEDIWFCTYGDDYYFNAEAVKLKKRVLAPYRNERGEAKDWQDGNDGRYRLTAPSNLWTDITIPFWSMPENTEHPTQKPEKLLAKIILASSRPGDLVLDPFLGSGSSAVVAKKLGRSFCGLEIDETYCCLALKRLELAAKDKTIQGYEDGIFKERNC
jgi:site-specific DNA-methyltransferase (adenine-specific)